VISVGNLTLGGTGKTPLVEVIATLLRERGHRVGVLSRGYGRRGGPSPLVASDGVHPPLSPEVAGDEPVLLARHLPGVPIIVGRDRYAAGMLAVERFGVDVVVLDDGFQHLSLERDLDIVLLDAARPLGTERLFPRGELRESPAALARADVIVFTGWEPGPSRLPATLPLPPPVFYSRQEPSDLCVLQDGRILPLASLNQRRVVAFCGIGTPTRFRRMLDDLGAMVIAFRAFPDHYPYTRTDFRALTRLAEAHGAEAMLTTEKDGIRLQRLLPLDWPVWQLRIRARVVNEGSTWESCLLRLWEETPG
jgi:tetraacyldisaccharide 4'-kinase